MDQTKPRVILKKYRSIFLAAAVVEAVSFLVSLIDSLVAGNEVGPDALVAVALMAPFFSINTFLASVVNSGTVLSFSEQAVSISYVAGTVRCLSDCKEDLQNCRKGG